MKTYKKIVGLFAFTMVFSIAAHAQTAGNFSLNLNYNVAIPTGDFANDVKDASWRGWKASITYGISDHLNVGLGTGFQDFYQKYPRQLYHLASGEDVSAVLVNSIQTVPVLAKIGYNFVPRGVVQPYIGAGVGGSVVFNRQYLGEFDQSKNSFAFTVAPEAGFFIPFGRRSGGGFTASGTYNYVPYNQWGVSNLDHWGVSAGFKIPLR